MQRLERWSSDHPNLHPRPAQSKALGIPELIPRPPRMQIRSLLLRTGSICLKSLPHVRP
jgi:hypothetical protein